MPIRKMLRVNQYQKQFHMYHIRLRDARDYMGYETDIRALTLRIDVYEDNFTAGNDRLCSVKRRYSVL